MTIQQIKKAFGGRIVAGEFAKQMIAQAVAKLPADKIECLIDHVWFFSSLPDTWAYAFHGNDLKNQDLIFLSDELFKELENQIQYTILHEIGHILLNHRNSIGFKQSKQEIEKQEKQADGFAYKYL
jgi:Zn-dependent peptidase ImmA (M78 family)